jgi:hypothetical protein
MKIKKCSVIKFFFLSIIICCGYNVAFAGWPQYWQVIAPDVAAIRNPLGFTLTVNEKSEATIYIPLLYASDFSAKKSLVKIKIDDGPMVEHKCYYDFIRPPSVSAAGGIMLELDKKLINQLMEGNQLKIFYQVTDGWAEQITFTLKKSRNAISKVLHSGR